MQKTISTGLQIAGLALVVSGVFWLSVPVGLIVAGVATVLVGMSLGNSQ